LFYTLTVFFVETTHSGNNHKEMSFPLKKKSMRMSNYARWHSNCIGRTFCLWHLISM